MQKTSAENTESVAVASPTRQATLRTICGKRGGQVRLVMSVTLRGCKAQNSRAARAAELDYWQATGGDFLRGSLAQDIVHTLQGSN